MDARCREERGLCAVFWKPHTMWGVLMALLVLPRASKVLSVLVWALAEESLPLSLLEPSKD